MNRVEIEKVVIKVVKVETEIEWDLSPEDTYTANICLREKLRDILEQSQVNINYESETFTYDVPMSYKGGTMRATFRGICIKKYWHEVKVG